MHGGIAVGLLATLALTACSTTSSGGGSGSGASTGPSGGASLTGVTWTLTSYQANGAAVPAVSDPDVATLSFGAGGVLSGSTGCNQFGGTYAQDGQSLTITPGAMTKKACSGGVVAQEAAILAALPKVASFTVGTSLTLLASDKSTLLTYRAAPSGLAGTSWHATGINNGKGAVVATADTEKVTAVFSADGQLSGSGGCNTYGATYATSGSNQIAIGPVAATAMACLDEGVMQTEQEYFAALGKVTTYDRKANQLTLKDATGATQVTFALTS